MQHREPVVHRRRLAVAVAAVLVCALLTAGVRSDEANRAGAVAGGSAVIASAVVASSSVQGSGDGAGAGATAVSTPSAAAATLPATISAAAAAGVTVTATDLTGATSKNGTIPLADVEALAPHSVFTTVQMVIGSTLRSYLVVSPATGAAGLPAIVILHGVNASVTQEIERDELLPLVEAGEAVLVYPAAYDEAWNVDAGGCCGTPAAVNLDDAGFVKDVVADVTARFAVSAEATYLLGFSNGGKLAYTVACRYASLFAAMAVGSAVPLASCSSTSTLPVLIAVGAVDPSLPSAQDPEPTATALGDAIRSWRARDGCTPASTTSTIGVATLTTWADCGSATEVTSVSYAGRAHDWASVAEVGDAAAERTLIWSFLSAHRQAT